MNVRSGGQFTKAGEDNIFRAKPAFYDTDWVSVDKDIYCSVPYAADNSIISFSTK
jgi:hypothetical protein